MDLKSHSVAVGPEGDVRGSVVGRAVAIEGKARGSLTAEEQIVLMSGADVEGNLSAPRIVLEDGASFRGEVTAGEGAAWSRVFVEEPKTGAEKIQLQDAGGRSDQSPVDIDVMDRAVAPPRKPPVNLRLT